MGQSNQWTVIKAPIERVWKSIRNFHDMSWAPNVITDIEAVGDIPGDQPGSKRVLNGAFRETLLELDDERRTFAYSIDDGPSPVSKADVDSYVGRVTVEPAITGNGTRVQFSSSWEKNDATVYPFCHGIYVALLVDMKRSLELPALPA
ncbi:MAG: SRPBCC family protein [Candidatus Zixiibacteriota bacterium]